MIAMFVVVIVVGSFVSYYYRMHDKKAHDKVDPIRHDDDYYE